MPKVKIVPDAEVVEVKGGFGIKTSRNGAPLAKAVQSGLKVPTPERDGTRVIHPHDGPFNSRTQAKNTARKLDLEI
jgi:hypothetical protein